MKPQLLVFDVNETLLDLSPMKKSINELLKNSKAFEDWFSKLIQFAMVETLVENYSDFGEIGAATLKMTAEKYAVCITEKDIASTLTIIKKLKPHPDVKDALEKLKSKGFRLVALTNGGNVTLKHQMEFSGLKDLFHELYSVETVRKFKPHPNAYAYVLEKEKFEAEKAMLIAAHAWDIVGAQHVGMQTAFIKRPGKFPYPKGQKPSLICQDLYGLYHKLVDHI